MEPDQQTELHGADALTFADKYLRKINVNPQTWETEYESTNTGEKWLLDYPQSELQGGGSPRLRKIAQTKIAPGILLKRTVAVLVFLFAEYCIISMAVFRLNGVWSYYQLLQLAPGILVAYLVFMPRKPGESKHSMNERLLFGACSLIVIGFGMVALAEIAWRIHNRNAEPW